jgi:hypothetical protein
MQSRHRQVPHMGSEARLPAIVAARRVSTPTTVRR